MTNVAMKQQTVAEAVLACEMDKPEVIIYTDGACSGNPGDGGWGAVVLHEDLQEDLSDGVESTTNNRMEMQAAIEALNYLPKSCQIDMYTDSKYLQDGITLWIHNWKKNGWKTAAKKPVKNQDLWQILDEAIAKHDIKWHWVRGHSGDEMNERADALATNAIIALQMLR